MRHIFGNYFEPANMVLRESPRRGAVSLLRTILGFTATLTLLAIIGVLIDFDAVFHNARQLDASTLAACIAAGSLILLCTSARWFIILRAVGLYLPWRICYRTVSVVATVNTLSPAKAGEVFKIVALKGYADVPTALGGILIERSFDFAVLAMLAGVGAMLAGYSETALVALALLVAIAALPVLSVTAGRLVRPNRWTQPVIRLAAACRRCRDHPGLGALALAITLVHWGVAITIVWYFLGQAGAVVPWSDVAVALPQAILVGLIPITLAGAGTRDAMLVLLLRDIADPAQILVASLLYTVATYVVPGLIGLVFVRGAYRSFREHAPENAPR